MSKDRAPKEILKDERSLLQKARDELAELPMDELRAFIKKSKSKNRGNPKEAGASLEVTKFKKSPTKERQKPRGGRFTDADRDLAFARGGGLMEATANLKARGMKEGGMVVKEKIVAIDTSPNSGLITVKGFGARRRT